MRVAVATASRSEYSLMKPLIDELNKYKNLQVEVISPIVEASASFSTISDDIEKKLSRIKPDLIIVPADRREMVITALVAFYINIPIVHLYAGSYTYSGTWDDIGRHIISAVSKLIFAESETARKRLIAGGEEEHRIFVAGTTHFDHIDDSVIESSIKGTYEFLRMNEDYDLLLINPVTLYDGEENRKIIRGALSKIDKTTIILPPNEDQNNSIIIREINNWNYGKFNKLIIKETLPRPVFLYLLKHCKRFISNSSSTVYEAPYFGIKVVNPTIRNSERDIVDRELLKGASKFIATKIATLSKSDPILVEPKRFRRYSDEIIKSISDLMKKQ